MDERIAPFFTDRKTRLNHLEPQQRRQLEQLAQEYGEPDAFLDRFFAVEFLADRIRKPAEEVSRDYETYARAYGFSGDASRDWSDISAYYKEYAQRQAKARYSTAGNVWGSVKTGFLDAGGMVSQGALNMMERFFDGTAGMGGDDGTAGRWLADAMGIAARDVGRWRERLREESGVDTEFAQSFWGQLSEGAGQLGYQIPAALTSWFGLAALGTQAYQGAVDDFYHTKGIDPARATDDQKREAFEIGMLNAIPQAALERLGIERMLGPVFRAASGGKMTWGQFARDVGAAATAEGLTEAGQGVIQDAIANATFDERDIMTDQRLTEFALGFLLGGGVSGVGTGGAWAGQRLRRRDADSVGAQGLAAVDGQQQTTATNAAASQGFTVTQRLQNEFNADGSLRLGVGEPIGSTLITAPNGAPLMEGDFATAGSQWSDAQIREQISDPQAAELFIRAKNGDREAQKAYNELILEPIQEPQAELPPLELNGEPDTVGQAILQAAQDAGATNITPEVAVAAAAVARSMGIDAETIRWEGVSQQQQGDSVIAELFQNPEGVREAWNRFADKIRSYVSKTLPSREVIRLGKASSRLQMSGVPDQEITLTQSIIDKAELKHRIRAEQLIDLPAELADPVIVFRHENTGNLDVLIDMKTDDGRSIIVGLKPNRHRQGLGEVTDIRTVHGKEQVSHIIDWINKGRATYWNKQKGQEFLEAATPANWERDLRTLGSTPNIASVEGNVNTEGDTLRQSEEWAARDAEYMAAVERGDMETAQRMANEAAVAAGYTTPAFHGRLSDFTEFDPKRSGSKSKTGAPEGAFFFSSSQDVAESYTVKRQGDFSRDMHDGANVLPAMLNLGRTPMRVNAKGENWRDIIYRGNLYDINELAQKAKEEGRSALVVTNVADRGVGSVADPIATTYVVFSPEQIKSADAVTRDEGGSVILLSQRFDAVNPNILHQSAKASVTFLEDGTRLIRLFAGADVSSLVHELAHIARRDLFDRTIPPEQRRGITDEMIEAAWEWAGAKDGEWTVQSEEKFARGIERYLRDGKAPNERLVPLFERLAQWMREIYDTLRGSSINIRISPEMRAVFDALMSREQYLRQNGQQQATDTGYNLTDTQLQEEARKGIATLNQDSEADPETRRLENAMSREAEAQLDWTPSELRLLEREAAASLGLATDFTPAEKRILRERARGERRLVRERVNAEAQADAIRERFAQVLQKKLAKNTDLYRARIDRIVERYQKQQGDVTEALKQMEALANAMPLPIRGKLRGFARLSELRTDQGFTTFLLERAEMAKKLVAEYEIKLEREALEKRIKALRKRITAAKKGSGRLSFDSAAVEAFLNELVADSRAASTDGRAALESFIRHVEANEGSEVPPEMVQAAANALSDRNIYSPNKTAAELRQIREDLEELVKTGRTARQARLEQQKLKRELAARQIIREVGEQYRDGATVEEKSHLVKELGASLIRPETWIDILTASDDSYFKKTVFDPLVKAANTETNNLDALHKRLREIFADLDMRRVFAGEEVITVGNDKITANEAMFIYAHSQNPHGRAHLERTTLKSGTRINEAVQQKVIAALPDTHKRAVDALIDYFDGEQYRRLAEVFYRQTGAVLPKEERYFPIRNLSRNATFGDILADRFGMAVSGIEKGMTKGRTGSQAGFRELDFFSDAVRGAAITEHYIAFAEPIEQARAILGNSDLQQTLKRRSPQAYRELRVWLDDVSRGRIQSGQAFDRWMDILRHNATTAAIGLNVFTALKVPASYFPALKEGDTASILKTTIAFADPTEARRMYREAFSKSDFLRYRLSNLQTEFAEMAQKGQVQTLLDAKTTFQRFRDASFGMLKFMDACISTVAWMGQYRSALHRGLPEAKAIREADALIRRTQSIGDLVNSARAYRSGGLQRAMLTFTTDINMMFNLGYKNLRNDPSAQNIVASLGFYALLPALYMALVNVIRDETYQALRLKDEDDEKFADKLIRESAGEFTGQIFGGIPLVESVAQWGAARAMGDNKRAFFASDLSPLPFSGFESAMRGDPIQAAGEFGGIPFSRYIQRGFEVLWKEIMD